MQQRLAIDARINVQQCMEMVGKRGRLIQVAPAVVGRVQIVYCIMAVLKRNACVTFEG